MKSQPNGNITDEYPEQLMVVRFLQSNAKVLELGANVGRNSCVIGRILKNSRNLVSLESDVEIAEHLKENRDANQLHFRIEPSALSKQPLIQLGWNTIVSNEDLPGYKRVKTITFGQLQKKYHIQFNTLAVDCEGDLYQTLKDDPKILRNITSVFIENNFAKKEQMLEVHSLFEKNGLKLIYDKPFVIDGKACRKNFYQVWTKDNNLLDKK